MTITLLELGYGLTGFGLGMLVAVALLILVKAL
jgi:hypothetical protein